MKAISSTLCCILLFGLSAQSASANIVSVSVTAHVVGWSDQANVLGGQIEIGRVVTGTYTYDTNAQNQGFPGNARYQQPMPPAAVSVSAGSLTFQSAPGFQSQMVIDVHPSTSSGMPSDLDIISSSNKLLNSGAQVALIEFQFLDTTGQWPASDLLPTAAPALPDFSLSRINITGSSNTPFQVSAQVDSVQLVPPSIEVSPAAGKFLAQQHFDAALLLQAGSQIASMQASANGNSLPLSYPGTCQLAPGNSTGRPAILCPNADAVLATLGGGATTINWQVSLADGTVLNQMIVWTLIQ